MHHATIRRSVRGSLTQSRVSYLSHSAEQWAKMETSCGLARARVPAIRYSDLGEEGEASHVSANSRLFMKATVAVRGQASGQWSIGTKDGHGIRRVPAPPVGRCQTEISRNSTLNFPAHTTHDMR